MAVRIEQVDLPGIGVRHDVLTGSGRRVSVLTQRSGERTLAVFDVDDPDSCRDPITLTDDEAEALAELLGASVMLGQLAALRDHAAGLYTEQIAVTAGSPFAGRRLGDTRARTRTGASIVALLRDGGVLPSPGPEAPLRAGDLLVAVGTREGLDTLTRLIADGAR
ncbi:cation:proton antiporter regulatory subunit [Jiangella alkaliphila]|uniref:Potassium/proton antiporter regulatory subunit, CPA2 family n=1 Tax=Jiangella alkaliphila TaxID=419479 RepID=A0A1H2INE1_9ACTN|nr:cation:proton antiporter regulatory subunit [Jiangella alkaliphila]SDU45690.1 potassium/proton antiporter regulatory subunit, CPA2 family [Jiangella alkaliphila]